ncbi:hypothetical protein [Arthrobacter sp. 35W]|uniref:hypothetical protein n=1 Tax=Arthrobacter sp. 35W TaxID=1132441 RepID=UPI00040613BE|nr:hypothetical protein [Arthrobacter sp. 35W]
MRRRLAAGGVVAVAALALAGCTISLPAQQEVPPTAAAPTSFAAPATTAGHDAAAVAAADMTFAAGATLSPGEPLAFADSLATASYGSDAAAPEWTAAPSPAAGSQKYTNAAGCTLVHWTTVNQGPLATSGDDRAATTELFRYLMPSVVESSLKPAAWSWNKEPGKGGPSIDFLSYRSRDAASGSAVAAWGRMVSAADMGLFISLACPTEAALDLATASASARLSVVPPSR